MHTFRFLIAVFTISMLCSSCTSKEDKSFDITREAAMKLDKNLSEDCITLCDEAINLWPENIEAHYLRAGAYASITEYQLAFEDYTQTIKLDPKHYDAYYGRGNMTIYLGGNREDACKDWTKAEELGKKNIRDKTKFCK